MKTFKTRDEIDLRYKWDIEAIYESDAAWESDFAQVQALMDKVAAFKGQLLLSSNNLMQALDSDMALDRLVSKLYLYAKMKLDENTRETHYQGLSSRAQNLSVRAGEVTAYLLPELLAGDETLIGQFMEEKEELRIFAHYFEQIMRRKAHTLSDSEEQLLAMTGELAAAPQNIFSMLNLADFKFPSVIDEKGKSVELTHGNFVPFMESASRELRADAFQKFYSVFVGHKNSIAAMVHAEVKKNVFYARARKHPSARAASLFKNNIDENVYDSLIEAVNKNLPHMHKYMEIRKKALKLKEFHMYDMYVPLMKEADLKVEYEEAAETVLASLKPLGESYCEVVKGAFEQRWIDVYENEGKRSGAYSWGTYDTKPYILLNHHGTLDNMFTLTHEMGHSMHSYLTRQKQPYVYGHYSIFLAEVASTTNEALLTEYLMKKEQDKTKKLYLLNHYLDQFRTTLFRQTMFAEFEREIHARVEAGEPLNADVLAEIYGGLNVKYYGPTVINDEEIKYEWTRIPHFYYNFYVFQYATGFSAAIALAKGILEQGQPAVDQYLRFLELGSSAYPMDVLKAAGADMFTGAPVEEAMKLFGELVEEFGRLMDEVKGNA